MASDCGTPPSISGGTVVTSEPYVNGSSAVYQCSTGYLMSGDPFITCDGGAWNGSAPTCTVQDINNIHVTSNNNYDHMDMPYWLLYLIAAVVVLLALLLFTCLLVWCCQLLGCFGEGGMFGEHKPGGCIFCCRRRNQSYDPHKLQCRTLPRRYEFDEDGRRYHLDDTGRRCYYNHKNKAIGNSRVTHNGYTAYDNQSEASTPRTTFVQVVNEAAERRQAPAKEIQAWKPHSNPIRTINTSTK